MRLLITGFMVSTMVMACKADTKPQKLTEIATAETAAKIKDIEANLVVPEGATAAETLLYATGADSTFKSMMVLSVDQMTSTFAQTGTNVDKAQLDQFVNIGYEEVDVMMPEIISDLGAVYEKHFSDEEMLEMAAFFQSGAGKKFIDKQQIIMSESVVVGEGIGQKLVERIQARLNEE